MYVGKIIKIRHFWLSCAAKMTPCRQQDRQLLRATEGEAAWKTCHSDLTGKAKGFAGEKKQQEGICLPVVLPPVNYTIKCNREEKEEVHTKLW